MPDYVFWKTKFDHCLYIFAAPLMFRSNWHWMMVASAIALFFPLTINFLTFVTLGIMKQEKKTMFLKYSSRLKWNGDIYHGFDRDQFKFASQFGTQHLVSEHTEIFHAFFYFTHTESSHTKMKTIHFCKGDLYILTLQTRANGQPKIPMNKTSKNNVF